MDGGDATTHDMDNKNNNINNNEKEKERFVIFWDDEIDKKKDLR